MKKILQKFGSIILALGEVLVGVLLLIDPAGFTVGIIAGVGMLLTALGVFLVRAYFKADPEEAAMGQNLMKGLGALTGGIFCIFRSDWFIVTFPLLAMFYGIIILITGIMKVQWAVDMVRLKKKLWYFPAAGAALTLIVAVVVLRNPFATTAVLWTFTAVSLIVEAVVDLLGLVFEGKGIDGFKISPKAASGETSKEAAMKEASAKEASKESQKEIPKELL